MLNILVRLYGCVFCFFKQKTAYDMRISDWGSDVCSSDLVLFRIDDRPYRIALAEAEARLASVRGEIMSLKASYRQKQEELALARTNLAFANTEFERQSRLVATNAVPRAKFDSVRPDLDVARPRIRGIGRAAWRERGG